MKWDEDSGSYPDVDSDEGNLKLDRHTSFPVIYSSPSRVVYAHHASQADPLEDTSDENYDIGEHAPGPPTYQIPTVYKSKDNQDEESKEEAKLPKSLFQSNIDSSSVEYIPPPMFYRPHLPIRSAYMNPRPIPVANRGYFSDSPVKRINNLMNSHPSSPSSPAFVYNNPLSSVNRIGSIINSHPSSPSSSAFVYNNPAPAPVVNYHPTPAPVVFSGPNSNAAVYSKPSSAQVVYKYALPSPSINKNEEHFHLNEKNIDYDYDNKPEPMIYDSSVYHPEISSSETTFAPYIAPYIYSDLLSPSNAFEDSFSSQPIYKFPSSNHISQGFAKTDKSHSLLNLYSKPTQYSIQPSHISSFENNPIPKIFENPVPIKNVYIDLTPNSDTESKTYKEPVPISNLYINSEDTSDLYEDLENSSTFDDIEYEDVDHDILDAIPVTYNEAKSESLNNNVKHVQLENKSISFNAYQTDIKSKSSEERIFNLPEVKAETTTTLPQVKIPDIKVKHSIINQNINIDTAVEAVRDNKMPIQVIKQVKINSPTPNRYSTFSSRRGQQMSLPNYSHRIAMLRASLRESQRQRIRERSSEEKTHSIYSFRNRFKYRTQGYPEKVISRRPLGRMLHRQSSEDNSSEERIYSRRKTPWGRRMQPRHDQSSEEDDEYKNTRTRISSRLNTRRLPEKTTTIKPKTTTVNNIRQLSRGRSRYENRNKNRNPQSLQCFLMSLIRTNYRC